MTKIKFKKKKIYPNLILGSMWLVAGTAGLILADDIKIFNYIFLVCGIVFLFLYDLKHQYLKIENHTIQKNFLYSDWNKNLKLEDIIAIEKTYLNYTLKTDSDSLKISADLTEDESYKEFKSILKGLNLPEDKIPDLI